MDEYREYLIGLGLKPKTVRTYELKLIRCQEWAGTHHIDLRRLKPSQAAELANLWPFTHSSRRQLRSTLVHYWQMNEVAGPAGAIRVPKPPRPRWRGLEDDQTRRLLRAAATEWPASGIVNLGLYLGMRREEIATIQWADFDHDLSWVRITGKDRTRDLPVHPRVRIVLSPHRWPGEYVFPGRLGGHISLTTINNLIAAVGQRAEVGHIHPHQLRHTSGGKVYDTTHDVYMARDWLGHVEVKTTQIYTRVQSERLVVGMESLDWEDKEDDMGLDAAA